MSRNATLTVVFTVGKDRTYALKTGTIAEAAEVCAAHRPNWLREPSCVALTSDGVTHTYEWAAEIAGIFPKPKGRKSPQVATVAAAPSPAAPKPVKARKPLEVLANGRAVTVPVKHASGEAYTSEQAKVWASTYKAQRKAGVGPVRAISRATKAAA